MMAADPLFKSYEAEIDRLREALVWQIKMGHTTAVPPVSVQHTMNGIRVSVGEQPWPVHPPTPLLHNDGTMGP